MAKRYTRKPGTQFFNKLTLGHKVRFVYDERTIIENMTDDDVLSYFFDSSRSIPQELIDALEKKALKCLKANNIEIKIMSTQ